MLDPRLSQPIRSSDPSWLADTTGVAKPSAEPCLALQRLLGQNAKVPFVVRMQGIGLEFQLDILPQELICKVAACTQQFGGTIIATADELSFLPLKDLPRRIESIAFDRLPCVEAMQSADAIELSLSPPPRHAERISLRSLKFQLPIDVPTIELLNKKLELLQTLAEFELPVGISIPIVERDPSDEALAWLRDLKIDFIILRSPHVCLGSEHRALSYFSFDPELIVRRYREWLHSANKSKVLIGVDYPWRDGYQAGLAHQAGADFVFCDSYLVKQAPMGKELTLAFDGWSRLSSGTVRGSADALVDRSAILKRLIHTWEIQHSMQAFVEEFQSIVEFIP